MKFIKYVMVTEYSVRGPIDFIFFFFRVVILILFIYFFFKRKWERKNDRRINIEKYLRRTLYDKFLS